MADYGLQTLFRNNPYKEDMQNTGAVLPNSGFAAPLLALKMGQDAANSQDWENQTASTGMGLLKQQMANDQQAKQQDNAQKVIGNVIKISKIDPVAATNILSQEAASNPALAPLKGIQFNAPTSKDNWSTVTAGNRQAYQVYLPGLSEIFKNPNDDSLRSKYIIPIGSPKAAKAPTTRTIQRGNLNVTQQWDGNSGQWTDVSSGPKWNPQTGNGAPRKPQDIVRDIRTTAASIASRLGDQSLTDAIVRATIKDPKILAAMQNKKDPYIQELQNTLDYYKQEYQQRTGKPWASGVSSATSPSPAPEPAPSNETQAIRRGNNIVYQGQNYPLNPDGTVTINGKKYRVQ